jgi:riboflavin-specific deaminase-like protein
MSVDGKITTKNFSPIDFTSREDKAHLLQQRALGDAVLMGYGTLKHDNVRLGVPDPKARAQRIKRGQTAAPLRVIVSNEGRIDSALKVFHADPEKTGPIAIFSTTRMPMRVQKSLREKATLHLSASRTVDLAWMLQQLRHDYGVRTVACEGGATLFRALLEHDLVDQLNLTIAPYLFGGANAPTLTGLSKDFLLRSVRCDLTDMRVVGQECFLTYRIKHRRG